jgi:hypothetical protein
MQTKRWWLSMTFIVSAAWLGGCGNAHLSSQYAQSYTAWFSAQHVKPKPNAAQEAKKIIESLDAQEASAVSKTYRRAVARGDEGGMSRMLTIGAPRAGGEGYVPPPSVP